ncbi:MAG: YbaK/EbsC family protein [Alphaproteobacteria bacterium]|nr:YbaK/EbsC family protein [Alphaproteobacteria bacterium]
MSIEKARAYLAGYNADAGIKEFDVSSATVELAAAALGCEPARIAKTISLRQGGEVIVVVTAGDVKIDNQKYKSRFGLKAAMLKYEETEPLVGHAAGGVCPFGLNPGVAIYLDESLRRFATVFPACGSGNSAIELSIQQLETFCPQAVWVDVCAPKPAPQP